jgi:hypothetical protein
MLSPDVMLNLRSSAEKGHALQRQNMAAVRQLRQLREQQPDDWTVEPARQQQQQGVAQPETTALETEIIALKQHWQVQHAATSQQLLQLQQQLDDCQQQPQLGGDLAAAHQPDDLVLQLQEQLDDLQQQQEHQQEQLLLMQAQNMVSQLGHVASAQLADSQGALLCAHAHMHHIRRWLLVRI